MGGARQAAQWLLWAVAIFAIANGIAMLARPLAWYEWVPTVRFTGPPNLHFLRDIGIAYLTSGLLLAYGAAAPQARRLAVVAGNAWLTLHGVLHVVEVLTGICAPVIFWRDAPAVLGPPLLVWLALAGLGPRRGVSRRG
jgi:hypothetical protein